MGIVLASPVSAAQVAAARFFGLGVTWTGWDGSVWDLTDMTGGVVLSRDGVEGLHFPPIQKWSSTSAAIPGKRSRGWQAGAREVFWPVFVHGQGSDAWLEKQRAFFNTIHPDRAGTWTVTAGGKSRSLLLTGTFEDSHRYDLDPYRHGWAMYGVTLEADQPYWQGSPQVYGPWSAGEGVDFIDESLAPDFHISSARTFANATARNDGDVDVRPVWRAKNALDNIVLGVGDSLIEVPFALIEGDELVIDTDPRRPTATLNGVDATAELGLQDYARIPTGGEVPLVVSAEGDGSITCTVTPLYFRAF